VIIAGAGPVGLSLGLTLAGQGVESIILERNDRPEPYSRAILIPTRPLDILQSWNLADVAKTTGIFNSRIEAYSAESGDVAMTIDFSELEDISPHAGFLFLPQDRIEALLHGAVQSSGHCKVFFGTTVSGFSQDGQGVTVEAISGGSRVRLRCQYLVGCDGAHSVVRKHLGLSLDGKTYQTRVLIADIAFSQHVSLPTPRIAFKAAGPLVLLRFDKTRWRVVGTVDAREGDEAARSKQGVAVRVRMLAGDVPFDLLWSSTFQIHSRAVERLRVQRVVLAGDAAHLSSPAGGMGMNSGIEDAYNLGWKLAVVLRGASDRILDSYERERLYAVVHSVERTSDIASNTLYFAPYPLRLVFMGIFGVAMKIRPIRRTILSKMSMVDTRYAMSELISGDDEWAGRIAPDHQMCGDAGAARLFQGRRGKSFVVCHHVTLPSDRRIETVEISTEHSPILRSAWRVTEPFCAIVRPDGFVAWAKKRPSGHDIEEAVNRAAPWLISPR
jgi:2-polyprenyl-6-methoxyphenol hydroxylase-like FAD-dependent oxidoreductase